MNYWGIPITIEIAVPRRRVILINILRILYLYLNIIVNRKKYRDLFKSVGNDINHRHFSLLTETTKSENVNRVLPLMEHNINYRKRRDIAPESVLAETYPSETNKTDFQL